MIMSDRQTLVAALTAHLGQRAGDYYPRFAGQAISVRAGKLRRRQFSELCELEIIAPSGSQRILAKVVLPPEELTANGSSPGVDSYFVASPDSPGAEFRALTTLAHRLENTDDVRFFSVRVLDSILDDRALLLEMADAQPLAQLLKSASRLHGPQYMSGLLEAVHRAGACLRTLHTMPLGEQRQPRGTTRGDFLQWITAAERFAAVDEPARGFYRRLCPRMIKLAEQVLPEHLPIAPLHDDFAPRNVLVDAHGRVAIIDLLEEWYGCVWEDIGQFLMAIDANKGQAISGGRLFPLARVEKIRESFLLGYYGEQSVPWPAVLLYEAQIILTKWAASQHRYATGTGWRGALKRKQLAMSSPWYAKQVDQCLRRAEAATMAAQCPCAAQPHLISGGTP